MTREGCVYIFAVTRAFLRLTMYHATCTPPSSQSLIVFSEPGRRKRWRETGLAPNTGIVDSMEYGVLEASPVCLRADTTS
jgi:hypothetical protein